MVHLTGNLEVGWVQLWLTSLSSSSPLRFFEWFSTGNDFASQRTFVNVWRQFWLLQLGAGRRVPLASSGKRPAMLLNILLCTAPPQQRIIQPKKCQYYWNWETLPKAVSFTESCIYWHNNIQRGKNKHHFSWGICLIGRKFASLIKWVWQLSICFINWNLYEKFICFLK